MLENINLRTSIRSLANEARAHRALTDSAVNKLNEPVTIEVPLSKPIEPSFEEKRLQDLRLKGQLELQKTLNSFFEVGNARAQNPFLMPDPTKRPVGRPKKLECEKVQRVGMKLPPELLKFLKELKIDGGRGFGSKMRAIINEWNLLKKREKDQLLTLKKNLDRLESVIKGFSHSTMSAEFVHKNEEAVKTLKKYCESVTQLASLYSFDVNFLKKHLAHADYKNYEFALFYLSNDRTKLQ